MRFPPDLPRNQWVLLIVAFIVAVGCVGWNYNPTLNRLPTTQKHDVFLHDLPGMFYVLCLLRNTSG